MLYVLDAFYPDARLDFRSRSYRVVPDSRQWNFEGASHVLAAAAKPVRCAASPDGAELVVKCRSEPPPHSYSERVTRENYERARTAFVNRIIESHAPVAAGDVIYKITDLRSSMAASLSVLRCWKRDYIVDDHAMTLALLDSSVVEPEAGFAGTIVLRPDADMLDAYI
jgi:hypothetical protein